MSELVLKGFEGQGIVFKGHEIELFVSGLEGYIIIPDNEKYNNARAIWNGMVDKKPGIMP